MIGAQVHPHGWQSNPVTYFDQDGYAVRLEWGLEGVRRLAPRCAVIVIVDVLVFSTSVTVALDRGGRVLALPWNDDRAAEAARRAGAVLTRTGLEPDVERAPGEWTLRPSSLVDLPAGTFLAISSLNGGTLCAAAAQTRATVLAGCLRNAAAVRAASRELAGDAPIGVVPAGERWRSADGGVTGLRPSLEDLLGAGAIADAPGRSPEAEAAALAYAGTGGRTGELLAECGSGRELAGRGVPADVPLAAAVDSSDVVPILRNGVFERWTG
jgi:2-phosphosulfolactate phosphatase